MKKYYRVNVVGHNDVILNRNTSETRFDQLQLLFYNLAARLQFYRDFGRSKPIEEFSKENSQSTAVAVYFIFDFSLLTVSIICC